MKYFNREWYLFGCEDTEETKKYIDYMQKNLPKWYNDFSFHDSKILSIEESKHLITLNLEFDDCIHTKYYLKLYNPITIEHCKLQNTWWISDEIYKKQNNYELHIMVDWDEGYGYFTVECSDIELIFMNRSYSIKHPQNETVFYD